ncbi:GPP34 family phosphoprotein [Geodermatophilus sp. SYSU D00814]
MADEDWDGATSMRLACLALDDRGRLTDDLVTALAVRGTLLVDLALRGRLAETEDAVALDGRPTGFPPADRLLTGRSGPPGPWPTSCAAAASTSAIWPPSTCAGAAGPAGGGGRGGTSTTARPAPATTSAR